MKVEKRVRKLTVIHIWINIYISMSIDKTQTYIFLVLFIEYNFFTNLIVHQFQLRC